MKLEFILKVEVEVEVAVEVEVEVEVCWSWTLEGGPGYPKYIGTLKFGRMTPFRVYNNPTKGFGLNFFGLEYIRKGFGDPPGASLSKFDLWGPKPPSIPLQTNREQYRPIIGIKVLSLLFHLHPRWQKDSTNSRRYPRLKVAGHYPIL